MTNLLLGDCLEKLQELSDNSIDSVVTDPPYGLSAAKNSKNKTKGGFMGKLWDYDVPSVEIWREVLRVLKPGGHLLSFGGTRTYHRMVVNIEDAGFEIRDMILWVNSSGFPKSQNISKTIDKQAGAVRKVIGQKKTNTKMQVNNYNGEKEDKKGGVVDITEPATKEAKNWSGWGSALKPACEPICLARKPLSENSIAENVLKWNTGGINIDDCRVPYVSEEDKKESQHKQTKRKIGGFHWGEKEGIYGFGKGIDTVQPVGRFPANVIHDGSEEVLNTFPHSKTGTAARFFYCAKALRKERGEGNNHPTVKPIKLMEYLVTLVTPPEGTVLDPFMGSGTTGIAAQAKGFKFIGIEREINYYNIACNRLKETIQKSLF